MAYGKLQKKEIVMAPLLDLRLNHST